ncbi:hypothetical protein EDC01DRAFT_650322 [Geopyxis carbonaria]|nr:hypothetical protein EDC01DRAFT_650322 [Geopyxis carbonaria]
MAEFLISDLLLLAQSSLRRLASRFGVLSQEQTRKIRDETGRLALWSDEFSVREGTLDTVLAQQSEIELQKTIILLLSSITDQSLMQVDQGRHILEFQFEKLIDTARITVPEMIDLQSRPQDQLPIDDWIEEFRENVDSLNDLGSFLQDIYTSSESPSEKQGLGEIEELETKFRPSTVQFLRKITQMFPTIDNELAKVLAVNNQSRYQRIRQLVRDNEVEWPGLQPEVSLGEGSNLIGSIEFENDDKERIVEEGSDIPYEVIGNRVEVSNIVLKMNYSLVRPFRCAVCFRTVAGIETKHQWQQHVIQDIRPYSCLHVPCKSNGVTFGSRNHWVLHEFTDHLRSCETNCIAGCESTITYTSREDIVSHLQDNHLHGIQHDDKDIDYLVSRFKKKAYNLAGNAGFFKCFFCGERIRDSMPSFQRHVGEHMDRIALSMIPRESYGYIEMSEIGTIEITECPLVLKVSEKDRPFHNCYDLPLETPNDVIMHALEEHQYQCPICHAEFINYDPSSAELERVFHENLHDLKQHIGYVHLKVLTCPLYACERTYGLREFFIEPNHMRHHLKRLLSLAHSGPALRSLVNSISDEVKGAWTEAENILQEERPLIWEIYHGLQTCKSTAEIKALLYRADGTKIFDSVDGTDLTYVSQNYRTLRWGGVNLDLDRADGLAGKRKKVTNRYDEEATNPNNEEVTNPYNEEAGSRKLEMIREMKQRVRFHLANGPVGTDEQVTKDEEKASRLKSIREMMQRLEQETGFK